MLKKPIFKAIDKLRLQKKLWTCMQMGIRQNCNMPAIIMNNGNEMPIIGFGTSSDNSEITAKAVGLAIDAGYTHIDCAHLYKNEREIGIVLKKKIKSGAVTRGELFITSKLWNTFHDPENVCTACAKTLKDLDLKYLDMYLMHSPMGFECGKGMFPMCDAGKPAYNDVDYVDTWKAMEELVENKICRSIGISNFNQNQIKRLLLNCKIIPQTLQIEVHPYLAQNDLIHYVKCHNISITAYAPMGSPNKPWANQEKNLILLQDYKILQLAEKHGRTPGQILLRYQIQIGNATIPKSTDRKHIQENINIFDFELCPEDIKNIESLDHNLRYFKFLGSYGHPHHPFENPK